MTDERYAVVESFTTSGSKEHYDEEGNLTEVTLNVAGGPFDNRRDAEQVAMVDDDEYCIIAITPEQDDD